MLVGKLRKNFFNGIEKIAKENNVTSDKVQIKLIFGESPLNPLKYIICVDWKQVRESNFKEVMDIKLDLIGQENIVVPQLVHKMAMNMQECGCEPEKFSAYLFPYNETIMVSLYCEAKNVKNTPIENLF